ncbi:preprotein translocase subunit SecG [uncultured Sanguibacteroides sp.]|uniref:preprotein translocase subunit SecG n=1 Tax=uncultured Sanguibacteroides sp. TaxID=1635151 RepID=UPI0025E33F56|nr:preprotein translocase subunit SecG [uncultured Sanguibacteroides sp.]
MYIAISVLIFIVCALLILIVLVQNSKGGGLSSTFASSNQIMGVRKTTDFLEKATWTLAGAMLVLCVAASMLIPREEQGGKSAIQEKIGNMAAPIQQSMPDFSTGNTDNSTANPSEENKTSTPEEK